MKLGHISDLHIWELDKFRPLEMLNKRLIGGANLLFKRSDAHSTDVVRLALEKLDEAGIDHLAITGDLTNLALGSEFRAARAVIEGLEDSRRRVSVIPGNHDYYTPGAVRERRFENHFAEYLESDLPDYQCPTGYPFVHIRDDVAIVGVSSCIATPPFFATGKVLSDELKALDVVLDDPAVRSRFKVVMIHHPLLPSPHHKVEHFRRLTNASDVVHILRKRRVDLAIHGHNHEFLDHAIPHLDGTGELRICEAGSTSTTTYSDEVFGGKYNIYHIEDARLVCIETHIFEANENHFRPWREVSFTHDVEAHA